MDGKSVRIDADKIMADVQDNLTRLDGCMLPHEFKPVDPSIRFGGRHRCELCAGEVQSVWAKYYIQGMRDSLKNYHESNDTMGEDQ